MERWITAHRIGIAAYLGSGLGGVIEDQRKLLKLRAKLGGLLKRYLFDSVEGDARARYGILLGLPPSVLHLLSQSLRDYPNLARRELVRLRREVYSASKQLTSPWEESEHTPLSYAQNWSHHLLFGSGSPHRLLDLGRSLTGNDAWKRGIDTNESFTSEVETLRDPQSSTSERCEAIGRMRRLLGMLPYWAQLENALFQQQFFWPLLVLRQEQGRGVAASVPVAIDVIFDNKEGLRFANEDSVLSNEWRRSLHRCMEIAKEMWQAEHWHRAVSTGDLIQGASVEFDFSAADRITSDATSLINRGIKVIDRSAEAYFVQAIMSRLLGASATVASAITGSVGSTLR